MSVRKLIAAVLAAAAAGTASHANAVEPLDLLFGTTGEPAPQLSGDAHADAEKLRSFLQGRMKQPKFYETVLPRLFEVLVDKPPPKITREPLKTTKVGGRTFVSLAEPPAGTLDCAPKQRVKVVPWWDASTTVWICPEQFHPEANFAHDNQLDQYCERSGSKPCACGPHLIYCAPGRLHDMLINAVSNEPLRTMQEIIERHLPFSTVLTSNATMRPGLLDFHYERAVRHEATQPFRWQGDDRDRWAWRPRPAVFGGGIISTPLGINWEPARRVVIATIWKDFLCMPLVSARTGAERLFDLPGGNLRFRSQDRLTAMVGCKECHARLEGAVHALAAFSIRYVGARFLPAQQLTENARLYGRDSHDFRGEGPSTPAWLGDALVHQPEFTRCMVQHVEELFYGGDAMSVGARQRVLGRFELKQDFAQLVEDVAVVRLVGDAGLDETVHASVAP